MDKVTLVAIDIAKNIFHVRAVNHNGKACFDSKVWRNELISRILSIAPKGCTIAMEACATSHYWGRVFQSMGYQVKLIPPQYVKPFVKSQKNDRADAEGIAEAASRVTMRTVAIKTEEQQAVLALHRVRTRLVRNRTQLTNEIRGLLAEFGVVIAQGKSAVRKAIVEIISDINSSLPITLKKIVNDFYEQLIALEEKIKGYEKSLKQIGKNNPVCKNLESIPGFGLITSTALFASFGKGTQFKNGRGLSAALGLVPKQNSSGGKSRLGRISKKGDSYLRQLLVHGARSYLKVSHRYHDPYSLWATSLRNSKGYNKAAVALANRNARIAWVVLSKGERFSYSPHNGNTSVH